jgi:hypothetical protein
MTTAHAKPFRRAVKAAGLDPKVATIYADIPASSGNSSLTYRLGLLQPITTPRWA